MRIEATVHQIQLKKEDQKVLTRLGRELGAKESPKIKAYLEAGHGSEFKPETWRFYSRVCLAEFDNIKPDQNSIGKALEDIYAVGNGYPRNPDLKFYRSQNATSISVGNIIIIGEDAYRVDGCGFSRVDLPRVDARESTHAH